ncbi:MAG TPA: carbon monoxide dehydrogenase subunit G [Kofleriaceae bacterium]|nr:carbon monoxide dehydrogenase subunit G [Kofleriaceae bacterium]
MKLEGDYLFEASVPEVWSALFDPVILAAVMPGCEKLDLVDGSYVGEIKVKVGPIQGKFTGKVDLTDKDEPHSYKMTVDGRGQPGFVKAVASVKLAAEGDKTRVFYDADAQIGGKIASVGQRLIDASARAIVAQSMEGLHTNIKLRSQAYRDAGVDPSTVAAAAKPEASAPAAAAAVNAQITDAVAPAAVATAVNAQITDAVAPAAAATAVNAQITDAVAPDAAATAVNAQITDAVTPAAAATAVNAQITDAVAPAAAATAVNAQITDAVAPASVDLSDLKTAAAEARAAASELRAVLADAKAAAKAAPTAKPAASAAPVAFTPVKVKQSDLANAVAKEVASSMFPRSLLVAIILVEAAVILWLLLRP